MTARHIALSLGCALTLAVPLKADTGPGSTPGGPGLIAGGGSGSPGITLCLSKEAAPADSLVQMKVVATEPKPISTGTGNLSLTGFDTLNGIAVSGDTVGVAVVSGNSLAVSLISSGSLLGNSVEYPILTVVGHVPAAAPIGTHFPMLVNPSALLFLDPTGTPYPAGSQPGEVLVNNGIAIGDVSPGSATIPAGGVVTLRGVNFVPDTAVQFSDVPLSSVQYVSPNRIDVTVGAAATMHGMMVTATNPDGSSSKYYSYERTEPMSPSADPLMQLVMPLLAPAEVTSATIVLPAPSLPGTTLGVAVQNIEATDTVATVELLDSACQPIASTQLFVAADHYIVRDLDELFGPASAGASVRVTSALPIEVVGVAANQLDGTAEPIPAR